MARMEDVLSPAMIEEAKKRISAIPESTFRALADAFRSCADAMETARTANSDVKMQVLWDQSQRMEEIVSLLNSTGVM